MATPTRTITFVEHWLVNGAALGDAYAQDGLRVSPELVYSTTHFGGPNVQYPQLASFGGPGTRMLSIYFAELQSAAAFALRTDPATTVFTALYAGTVVEVATAGTSFTSGVNYFGFSGILFDQITFDVTFLGTAGTKTILIDNVQFGAPVPEPATAALLVFAAAVLSWCYGARARRAAARPARVPVAKHPWRR